MGLTQPSGDAPLLQGAGPPTSGIAGTGAGFAPQGARYFDTTNKVLYSNQGTVASPSWAGVQTSEPI